MARVIVSALRISSMLANRNRSVSDAASALSLSVHLQELVSEDSEVSFEDLVALGRYFKKPWSYILIDGSEVFDSVGQDNRSIGNLRRPLSPELLDAVEAVNVMLAAAADLFSDTRCEVPPTRITPDTSPETAGAVIRDFLGVSVEKQIRTHDEFEALRVWTEALQARGIYVSQRRLQDETVRAFSRVAGDHAVVVLDTGDTAYARAFSLLHEYCHVILRSTGLCDLSDQSRLERHCNAVAAATLMPRSLVASKLAGRRFDDSPDAADNLIRDLSHELRVSQAALLIRLRELGVLNQAAYDALEDRRAARRAGSVKNSGGTYYPPRINRVGRRYARNVFSVLDDGLIDRQDASALLEIGEHLLSTYHEELERPAKRLL